MRRLWAAVADFLDNRLRWKKWSQGAGVSFPGLPIFRFKDAVAFAIEADGQIDVFGAALHPRLQSKVKGRLSGQLVPRMVLDDLSKSAHELQPFSHFRISGEMQSGRLRDWLKATGCSIVQSERGTGKVAMATLFQQGPESVVPWLNHHRELGVDHFLLAYNGNPPEELVDALVDQCDVRLIRWDLPYSFSGSAWDRRDLHYAQPPFLQWAYRWCELSGFDRVLTCDLDEFILSDPTEFKELMRSGHSEVVFENVWAKTESRDSRVDLKQRVAIAEKAMPRVCRGKSAKRVGVFDSIDVHYTSKNAVFGGWFLHFAHQTGGVFRPESEFHWTEPMRIEDVRELLPTLELPMRSAPSNK